MDSVQLKGKPRSLKPRAFESDAFDQTRKSMQQIIDFSESRSLKDQAAAVKLGLEAIQAILPDGRNKKKPSEDSQAADTPPATT